MINENGAIEPNKPLQSIQKEPYSIPKDFEWCQLNLQDEAEVGLLRTRCKSLFINTLHQMKDVYELLSMNYAESSNAVFRFDYSAEFLRW